MGKNAVRIFNRILEEMLKELPPQQQAVFRGWAEGLLRREIAAKLQLRDVTVAYHTTQILKKFKAKRMAQLLGRMANQVRSENKLVPRYK